MNTYSTHIAFVHKEFPYGGAEKVTLDIANYLCSHGYMVTILTIKHNEHLYSQGCKRLFKVELLPPCNIKYSKSVAHFIRDFINKYKVSVLVTSRELLYAKWLKSQTKVKLVFELHSSPYYEILDIEEKKADNLLTKLMYNCGIQWIVMLFYRNKYKRIYGWADAYGVLCEVYKEMVADELKLNSDNKLWVLPNAVEVTIPIVWDKQKVVVYIGRLSYRDKRVDRLLRIWQGAQPRMEGWQLKIIGGGHEKKYLQQQASLLGLKNVSFEGQTNDVKQYYDEAAILCLTSSFEGWPMSVAEAQANGVVPLIFDSFQGAKEMITTIDEGIRITPFDETAFAEALVQLGNDSERLCKMRKCVVEKAKMYNIEKMGETWMKMLTYLLIENRRHE